MTEYDGNQMELTQLSGGGWPGTAVGDAPMVEQGICSTEGNAAVQQEEQPLVLDLTPKRFSPIRFTRPGRIGRSARKRESA